MKGPIITMDDKEIIALYWERNTLAIDRTMEKYGSYCAAIARNILGSEENAEECVNDTWLGAWNSIPPKRPEHLPGFLGKLTRSSYCKQGYGIHKAMPSVKTFFTDGMA